MSPNSRRKLLLSTSSILLGSTLPAFSAPSAIGRKRALLVGASDYEQHRGSRLEGPPNDIVRVRAALSARGFNDIEVLADRVPEAIKPTRSNILSAFRNFPKRVSSGDLVFVYFSGHGAQQPVIDPSTNRELDALDEVILATDAGRWRTADNTIENAVVDDEIGAFVGQCRARDAFVWAVFDTCHAGDVTRGALPHGMRERAIRSTSLGLPPRRRQNVQLPSILREQLTCGQGSASPQRGGLLAFFASKSDRKAVELPMPPNTPDAQYAGLFTHVLLEELHRLDRGGKATATYGELIAAIQSTFESKWGRWEPDFCAEPLDSVLKAPLFVFNWSS